LYNHQIQQTIREGRFYNSNYYYWYYYWCRPGIVVSALASINEVNQHRAWLILKWVMVSGFNS